MVASNNKTASEIIYNQVFPNIEQNLTQSKEEKRDKIAANPLASSIDVLRGPFNPLDPVNLRGFFKEGRGLGMFVPELSSVVQGARPNYDQLQAIIEMESGVSDQFSKDQVTQTARNEIKKNPDISPNDLKISVSEQLLLSSGPSREQSTLITESARERGDLPKEGESVKDISLEEALKNRDNPRSDFSQERFKPVFEKAISEAEKDAQDAETAREKEIFSQQPVLQGDIVPLTRKQFREAYEKSRIFGRGVGESPEEAGVGESPEKRKKEEDIERVAITNLVSNFSKEGNDAEKAEVGKDYINDFMSAMPKYEGKTKFEKNMDLMKLGMAIAAGGSSNAIENVSKGFLAMGDTFTEDAREKRLYDRELRVAAGKYKLDSLLRDKQQAEQDRRDITTFRAREDAVLADGKQIKKGDVVNLDKKYIVENGIPKGLLRLDYDIELSKNLTELEKLLKEQIKAADAAKVMTDKQIANRRTLYGKSYKGVEQANKIVTAIDDLQRDLIEEKVLFGIEGVAQASKESLKKLFGLRSAGEKLSRSEWIARVQTLVQRSIPVTLGEDQSANSISNRDVERLVTAYFELIGEKDDVFGFETAFKDPKVFFNKLDQLRQKAIENRKYHVAQINSVHNELSDRTTQNKRPLSEVFDPIAQEYGAFDKLQLKKNEAGQFEIYTTDEQDKRSQKLRSDINKLSELALKKPEDFTDEDREFLKKMNLIK